MKKPAPTTLIATPHLSVHSGLSREDALAYAQQLLQGIEESLDGYRTTKAGTSEMHNVLSAVRAARTGQTLLAHVMGLDPAEARRL
ncbi:hypothetical protein SJI00_16215 [Pseudomonas sp. RP23018S]|uniref:hypothetical protein n=1 Tax=Pseudomonas sp. RP23018S TaxID=3096037 RepID=UPI002ACAF30C|nr:hypothetical protein [Pseudomonas sp. RP23018S]MDZ5604320.1 hypothetical protein [Pseudomonas sp. RP23018S]